MAQAKVINIEDAKLKTLSVEIKALTVSGKQMTIATFKQLPWGHAWPDGGGKVYEDVVVWGYVVWNDNDCVVFQRGDRLFRHHIWDFQHQWVDRNYPQLFIAV